MSPRNSDEQTRSRFRHQGPPLGPRRGRRCRRDVRVGARATEAAPCERVAAQAREAWVVTAKRPPPPPAPRPLCTTRSRPLPLVALIPSPRRCRLTRRRGQRPPREPAWSPANSGSGAAAPALRGACEWLFPSGSRLTEVARGTCRRALRPRLGPHAAVRPQTPRDADSQLPPAPKTTLLLRAALSPQTRAS